MRLNLFDVDEFVDINKLEEITSPVLFERGGIPNSRGLISNEIFGVSVKSRKETFAYIDLGGHFIHPHIYKIIRRVFRNIDKIINGEQTYSISETGQLVKDPNGETGIGFLYDNWSKIKWIGNEGMSKERTDLISKSKKNEVWISKQIVIPAFYRDIRSSEKGQGGNTVEINNMYTKLIRNSALIKDGDMFDFSFYSTEYNIQKTIVDIYDYFKDKLDKKSGLLRKYLLGKNVDYCTRVVISCPIYSADDPRDNIVDFRHSGVPISQVCVLAYPFVVAWLRNFFERELIENKTKWLGDKLVDIKNPESYFNDTYIKKHIDKYVYEPSSRYDTITIPLTDDVLTKLKFTGKYHDVKAEESGIANRYVTWTDLLYLAATDVVKNKHIMVTRYPISNNFGIFISRMRVLSTLKTIPTEINGHVYKWYPYIDLSMPKHAVANNFNETIQFSNAYLTGLNGDYDGDQITAKIPYTQEANEECEKLMSSKQFFITSNGKSIRHADLEAVQTLYALTKDPK